MTSAEAIAPKVHSVLTDFERVLRKCAATEDHIQVASAQWQSEYDRLCLWVANLGAHQAGRVSLDYRLRDASHIREQVLSLLETLQTDLKDLYDIIDETVTGDAATEGEGEGGGESETEMQQIYRIVSTNIRNLLRLSMLIRRNPAQYDRVKQSQDMTAFLAYDVSHIRDKFPSLDPKLVERLGQANSKRRAIRKYRERHQQKLKHGLDNHSIAPSSTQASEISVSTPIDPGEYNDNDSTAGTETSFAPSLFDNSKGIRIPRPPAPLGQGPFECDHCLLIVDIDTTLEWASHVLKDLQAYQCLFVDCSSPHRLYSNRHEWFSHLTTEHHIEIDKAMEKCPICGTLGLATEVALKRHLGRHLQDLALFIIPPDTSDDTEDLEFSDIDSEDEHMASGSGPQFDHPNIPNAAAKNLIDLWVRQSRPQIEAFLSSASAGISERTTEEATTIQSLVEQVTSVTKAMQVMTGLTEAQQIYRSQILDEATYFLKKVEESKESGLTGHRIGRAQDRVRWSEFFTPPELRRTSSETSRQRLVSPSPPRISVEKSEALTDRPTESSESGVPHIQLNDPVETTAVDSKQQERSDNDVSQNETAQNRIKGILKEPRSAFPEGPMLREGVAPRKLAKDEGIPIDARWTKIDRRLVNPQALEEAGERFEERSDCVIVLRVLTKGEIQNLADRTKEIRDERERLHQETMLAKEERGLGSRLTQEQIGSRSRSLSPALPHNESSGEFRRAQLVTPVVPSPSAETLGSAALAALYERAQGAADQTATNAASAMQDGLTADYKEAKKGRDAALKLITGEDEESVDQDTSRTHKRRLSSPEPPKLIDNEANQVHELEYTRLKSVQDDEKTRKDHTASAGNTHSLGEDVHSDIVEEEGNSTRARRRVRNREMLQWHKIGDSVWHRGLRWEIGGVRSDHDGIHYQLKDRLHESGYWVRQAHLDEPKRRSASVD